MTKQTWSTSSRDGTAAWLWLTRGQEVRRGVPFAARRRRPKSRDRLRRPSLACRCRFLKMRAALGCLLDTPLGRWCSSVMRSAWALALRARVCPPKPVGCPTALGSYYVTQGAGKCDPYRAAPTVPAAGGRTLRLPLHGVPPGWGLAFQISSPT